MDIRLEEHSELVSRGKLYTFDIAMKPIPDGRIRTIRVWLPEAYDGARRFPVLYMHDGQQMFPGPEAPAGFGSWQVEERISSLEPELQCILCLLLPYFHQFLI